MIEDDRAAKLREEDKDLIKYNVVSRSNKIFMKD